MHTFLKYLASKVLANESELQTSCVQFHRCHHYLVLQVTKLASYMYTCSFNASCIL